MILQKQRWFKSFPLEQDGLILLKKFSKMIAAEMPHLPLVLDSLEATLSDSTCLNTSEMSMELTNQSTVSGMHSLYPCADLFLLLVVLIWPIDGKGVETTWAKLTSASSQLS